VFVLPVDPARGVAADTTRGVVIEGGGAMAIAVGLAMVLACVVLARVARGSTLCGVFTALGVWLALLLVLYILGMAG